jgi:hypothetical protein
MARTTPGSTLPPRSLQGENRPVEKDHHMPQPLRSLRVWLNAFIPAHVPGLTDELTTGPHAGKTVLYGLAGGKEAYLTDQRMFAATTDAASQMHSEALVESLPSPARFSQWHECGFAMPLGSDGEPAPEPETDTSRMNVVMATPQTISQYPEVAKAVGVLPRRPGPHGDDLYLYFRAKATPPCAQLAAHFGDIAYEGIAIVDLRQGTLDFSGLVHRFPAFEMYASANEAPPVAVFQLSPPRGSTALHEKGPASRPVKASVKLTG